ncbi:GNAT family N-acetyltransferase [Deinococcus malanensis]
MFGADSGGFIAVLGGAQVVGCVGYRPDGAQTLTLNKLVARPEVRGQGIGRLLVQAVEGQARQDGYARVLLAVSQFNREVMPFYIRLGYVRSEEPYAHAHPASPAPAVFVKLLDVPA